MLAACARSDGFALVRTSLVADALEAGTLVRCYGETQVATLNIRSLCQIQLYRARKLKLSGHGFSLKHGELIR